METGGPTGTKSNKCPSHCFVGHHASPQIAPADSRRWQQTRAVVVLEIVHFPSGRVSCAVLPARIHGEDGVAGVAKASGDEKVGDFFDGALFEVYLESVPAVAGVSVVTFCVG